MAKAKAALATQYRRLGAKKNKSKVRHIVEIVRPWKYLQFEELIKEDRDIVVERLQKEVADVPATCSYAVRGVNQVVRAISRREVQVVVFASNPESLAFGHLPLLCRLHRVPICVLHLSSKTFGRVFKLKSMVAVGMKAYVSRPVKAEHEAQSTTAIKEPQILTEAEQQKLASITDFLIAKASKRT
ncbi:hypothetical protein CCR75_000240 [Bremia lactucae]|uniref:Ribosomal protein eL8/eL30/eS12/Gadd45 domain-containing protein n=1 Tax=Bremia lactucae TaxID=4779 RepID=A0A976FD87_BRELC|nr:hypothetical protein CCR75_000240 [Bremia lactucae]